MTTPDDDLSARIKQARSRHKLDVEEKEGPSRNDGGAIGQAFTISAQLVVAVVLGVLLGRWMDQIFGTSPLFLIVMMLLFTAAGFLNVFRGADRAHRDGR